MTSHIKWRLKNMPCSIQGNCDIMYFGVHNLGNNNVTMYTYCEHEGKKGPSEVTSMLLDYLVNLSLDEFPNELVLISDGCPDQKKNKVMV